MISKLIYTSKKFPNFISKIVASSSEIKKFENNFLTTTNIAYIESLYQRWTQNRTSVSPSFQTYFQLLEKGQDPDIAFISPPKQGQKLNIQSASSLYVNQQLKVRMMIERYRTIGHQFGKVDPLEQDRSNFVGSVSTNHIKQQAFGFTQNEMQYEFDHKSARSQNIITEAASVKTMKQYLESVYCSKVGYEYMHLLDKNQRDFIKNSLQQNIETLQEIQPTKQERIKSFNKLCKDQTFIDFLVNKFGHYKRFGIQGLNSATSALQELVQVAAKSGVQNLVLGMAHRGRLNTLHCVFDKPPQTIFRQFLQKSEQEDQSFSGDVKYHLGYTKKKKFGENEITLSILPNPSHLQAVNPLVSGSIRAIQQTKNDKTREKSLGVIIHGDAAMSGQGIMYEASQMLNLNDYTTGGIIHFVMNNQIGFTTNPSQGRSSYYCTEIAKAIGVPVFHVNANQPALLDRCVRIAVAYRQKFKKDIFIDIVGYRRYGHNEQDQPSFTQPFMYQKIKSKPTVYDELVNTLISKEILTAEQIQEKRNFYFKSYEQDYAKVINDKNDKFEQVEDSLFQLKSSNDKGTGVTKSVLESVFKFVTTWPQDFNIHPTIKKIYNERIKNFNNNENLDWATMQSLAFASLLQEGYGVRLSGEDVERGTFSHRHALISDQKRDVPKYNFLKSISPNITICNSHLSQYGIMGFEYGYTITNPNYLTIWEAQFGDFANGAEIIIDNYLVCGETKWNIQSGLVLNLPHGMDGQGPEHSCARIQRFLQLSDDNCDVNQDLSEKEQLQQCNIQVVSCSTSANYFHAMRRQMHRNYRKPLIMFNSKKLLKFKPANCSISQILEGTEFSSVYPDESKSSPSSIKKVFLCNGQFYYELKTKREELKRNDIAIVRVQQIAPFPHQSLSKVLSVYGKDTEYFWVQEEHENYGCWNFIYERMKKLLGKNIGFYGRGCSGSTAAGMLKMHKKEEEHLLNQIFS